MIRILLEKETSAHKLSVAYLVTEKQKMLGAVHRMDKAEGGTQAKPLQQEESQSLDELNNMFLLHKQ